MKTRSLTFALCFVWVGISAQNITKDTTFQYYLSLYNVCPNSQLNKQMDYLIAMSKKAKTQAQMNTSLSVMKQWLKNYPVAFRVTDATRVLINRMLDSAKTFSDLRDLHDSTATLDYVNFKGVRLMILEKISLSFDYFRPFVDYYNQSTNEKEKRKIIRKLNIDNLGRDVLYFIKERATPGSSLQVEAKEIYEERKSSGHRIFAWTVGLLMVGAIGGLLVLMTLGI